ncbi:hypothetical protein [Sorangium cellulosum]|uniref:hypothetical protein n=1 Tax=Sorangium cellulosum TaxID=56 RepID=UPI00101367E2|nr:hypothetical protein [Sorangium cellulosum]
MPGSSPPLGHPAFHTGVVHVEPELRDEVEAYWQEYAAWERTRQGPPPRAPSVSVRVDHEGKPAAPAAPASSQQPVPSPVVPPQPPPFVEGIPEF